MGNTREEVEDETLVLLATTDASTEYSLDRIRQKNRDIYLRICSGNFIRLFPSKAKIKAKRLPFLDKKIPINLKNYAVATDIASVGATEIDCDTTNFLATGFAYVMGNIIQYTSKSATQLLGVTGLLVDIKLGDIIDQIFLIDNVDVAKPKNLTYQTSTYSANIFYLDPYSSATPAKYFTILNNGSQRFIYIVGCDVGLYRFSYSIVPPVFTQDSDQYLLPEDKAIDLVAPLSAGELLWKSEEIDLAKEKLDIAYGALEEFYGSYLSDIDNQVQQIDVDWTRGDSILGPVQGNNSGFSQYGL